MYSAINVSIRVAVRGKKNSRSHVEPEDSTLLRTSMSVALSLSREEGGGREENRNLQAAHCGSEARILFLQGNKHICNICMYRSRSIILKLCSTTFGGHAGGTRERTLLNGLSLEI